MALIGARARPCCPYWVCLGLNFGARCPHTGPSACSWFPPELPRLGTFGGGAGFITQAVPLCDANILAHARLRNWQPFTALCGEANLRHAQDCMEKVVDIGEPMHQKAKTERAHAAKGPPLKHNLPFVRGGFRMEPSFRRIFHSLLCYVTAKQGIAWRRPPQASRLVRDPFPHG